MVLVDELGEDDPMQRLIFLVFGMANLSQHLLAKLQALTGLSAEGQLREAAVEFH